LKAQLSEAVTELKTVKEATVTSEFINSNTALPEYVLYLSLLFSKEWYWRQRADVKNVKITLPSVISW